MVDSASMAANWSSLPSDILIYLTKNLNSDVDLLHLRSVCSSWRSSLPLRPKRFTFPLKVPSSYSPSNLDDSNQCYYLLDQNTIYRLSPPDHGSCAGDSSDGWLFKVSETAKANTFSLLAPLFSDKIKSTRGMVPKHLNLLDYRILEICKSYSICFVNTDRQSAKCYLSGKVIALWNYVVDCDFVALTLRYNGDLDYWKFGDDKWNKIHTKGHRFQDLILYNGKCYAIDSTGVLVLLDSELNVTVVSSTFGYESYDPDQKNYLVECKSHLYAVSKLSGSDGDFYFDEYTPGIDLNSINMPLDLTILKKIKDVWNHVVNLGELILILGEDVSFGVSAKDFGGFKGNFVLLINNDFYAGVLGSVYGDFTGVYDLDTKRSKGLIKAQEYAKLFWPPPTWLMPTASSSGS